MKADCLIAMSVFVVSDSIDCKCVYVCVCVCVCVCVSKTDSLRSPRQTG